MTLWVITTEDIPLDVLGAEDVSEDQAEHYLEQARELARSGEGSYRGRVLEQGSGQVYQVFDLLESNGGGTKTVFIADPGATAVVRSLFDEDGSPRKISITT